MGEKNLTVIGAMEKNMPEIVKKINVDVDKKLIDITKSVKQDMENFAYSIKNENDSKNKVRIQESIFHQHEQVKKVDAERQQAAQKAKDDYEATVLTNASAIADLKSELTHALLNVEKVENRIDSRAENIEGRLKKNEDNIKHIDDTLDGLKRNDEMFELRLKEVSENFTEKISEQERKIKEQENNDVQLIKDQIITIENDYNITKK